MKPRYPSGAKGAIRLGGRSGFGYPKPHFVTPPHYLESHPSHEWSLKWMGAREEAIGQLRNVEEFTAAWDEWAENRISLVLAIELVKNEAATIPEVTEVVRTRFGTHPTFVLLTSNRKFDPNLHDRVTDIDLKLARELPKSFRFTILCFPLMDRTTSEYASGEYEVIYARPAIASSAG